MNPKLLNLRKSLAKRSRKTLIRMRIITFFLPKSLTKYPLPSNETERLQFLHSLQILDTKPEREFDKLTALCSNIFHVPICLISLVDRDRQWFKSKCGLDSSETARGDSFCTYAIQDQSPIVYIVPNALEDPIFREGKLVLGPPYVRFYAGFALNFKGLKIGTLCIVDTNPRVFSEGDTQLLVNFGDLAMEMLKDRQKSIFSIQKEVGFYGLRYPINNAEKCLNILRTKFEGLSNDPFFEKLELNLGVSKLLLDNTLQYNYSNPTSQNISKISIYQLFNDLKKFFSFPNLQSKTPDMEFGNQINWNLSHDCPESICSYSYMVFNILVDFIGGAFEFTKNIDVLFCGSDSNSSSGSPEKADKYKKKKRRVSLMDSPLLLSSSLYLHITINNLTLTEESRKTISLEVDDTTTQKDPISHFFYSIKYWSSQLSGSFGIEELDNGVMFSMRIPSQRDGAGTPQTPQSPRPSSPNKTRGHKKKLSDMGMGRRSIRKSRRSLNESNPS
eukprot:TRINITY_DN5867_c0_g1_i3.p1 TRINITY_DN5867_c0_g1~~TRINITY_DN5867_c0_g1_i3.p1  ORF type:complete len:502 (-),score=134.10 TRINITY_DN5867_c0_g1_i3:26-1531(-)